MSGPFYMLWPTSAPFSWIPTSWNKCSSVGCADLYELPVFLISAIWIILSQHFFIASVSSSLFCQPLFPGVVLPAIATSFLPDQPTVARTAAPVGLITVLKLRAQVPSFRLPPPGTADAALAISILAENLGNVGYGACHPLRSKSRYDRLKK